MRKLYVAFLAFSLALVGCKDDPEVVLTNGGTLSGGPFTFTVDDGVSDFVSDITISGEILGSNTTFVITDDASTILGMPADLEALEAVDFEGAGAGICYIWYLAYEDGIQGLAMGENADEISGNFDFSNSIEVTREAYTNAGTLVGGPFDFNVGDGIVDNVSGITNSETPAGTNSSYIITDDEGNILGLPVDLAALEGVDFDGAGDGVCLIWYIRYEDGLTGLEMGENANDLSGNFSLSNSITVNRTEVAALTLSLTGLENLGEDYVYEGWIMVDGSPVTTGVFTVDDSGTLSQTEFYVTAADLTAATAFVLSIEPAVDTDPAPAETKLLMGDFSGDSADVTSTGIVADFTNSTGKYILATPTDTDDTNEYSGVWFLDNSSGSTVAGLDLPTLSDGWVYEGWVVIDGTPVSTGTFTSVDAADDNASTSPYKGTSGDGPAFPGEDYVMGSAAGVDFPTDLRGSTLVISVEPSPDNSTAPFTLKPLAQEIPSMAGMHTTLDMGTGSVQTISGTVSR